MMETKKSFRKQRSRSDVETSDASLGVVSKLCFNLISFIMCYPISSLTNDCVNLIFVKIFGRSLRDVLSTWLFKLLWYFPWSITDQMNTSINLLGFLPEVLLSLVLKDLVLIHFNYYPVIEDPRKYSNHDRVQNSTTRSKGHSKRRKREMLHRNFMLSSDEYDSPPLERDYYSNNRQHDRQQRHRIPVDAFFFFRICWRLVTSFIQIIVTGISKPLPKYRPSSSLSDSNEDLSRSHHRHTRGRHRVKNHHKTKGHRQRHLVETATTTSSEDEEIAPPSRYPPHDNTYLSDEIVMTSSCEESDISEDEREPPLRQNKKTRARRQNYYDNQQKFTPNTDVVPPASARRKMINKQQQTVDVDDDVVRLQQIYQKIKIQNKKKRKAVEKNFFREPHVVHSSGDAVPAVGKPHCPSLRSEEYETKSKSRSGVQAHTKPVHSRPSVIEHRNSNLDRTSFRSHRSSKLDHRPSNLNRDLNIDTTSSHLDHRPSNLDRLSNIDHRSSTLGRRSNINYRASNLDNRPSNLDNASNLDHRSSNLERAVDHRSSTSDKNPPNLHAASNMNHRASNRDEASTLNHNSSNLDRTGMGQGDCNRKSPSTEDENSAYLIERDNCNDSPPLHHRNTSEEGMIENTHTNRDPSFRIPHNNRDSSPVRDCNESDTNLEGNTSDESRFDKTAHLEASALATKYLRRSRRKGR